MNNQLLEFQKIIRAQHEGRRSKVDKHTRKLLFYIFTGTRGGVTRLRIIVSLLKQPQNANQLSKELDLDYKAIRHHMQVLERNSLVSKMGDQYGTMYCLSDFLEMNLAALDEAIDKLSYNIEKKSRKKVYY